MRKLRILFSASLVLTLAFLTLMPTTGVASIITSFDTNFPACLGVPLTPVVNPGPNHINFNLTPGCDPTGGNVKFNFVAGPSNTYNFDIDIMNNLNRVITDLHLELFQTASTTWQFVNPVGSVPFLPLASQTPTLLDFIGPPDLPSGSFTNIHFSILAPAANVSGFNSITITPTFTRVPEPATFALVAVAFASLCVSRRRKSN